MNRLRFKSQHQHVFQVNGYAPAEDPNVVEKAVRKSVGGSVFSGMKNLIEIIDELRCGRLKVLPFKRIDEAIRMDGFNTDIMIPLQAAFLKFSDHAYNLVVNVGLDDILDKYYKGSGYTAAHYCGITAGTPSFAEGDTMASHAGWTEITAYDEAVRQTITWGTVSSQSLNNSSSKAVYTISSNGTTIGGGFVVTNSTKGGSTGTLVGGAAFSAGNKTLDDNDTLSVTVTATAAAS
jgi:hypothetical protein